MRALATLSVLCALGAGIAAAAVTRADAAPPNAARAPIGNALIAQIDHYRNDVWHWQSLMGLPKTHSAASARTSPDLGYRKWVLHLWEHRSAAEQHQAVAFMAAKIRGYEESVAHWQHVMGTSGTPVRTLASSGNAAAVERQYRLWQRRAATVWHQAQTPPYASAFECIHRYEGSWTDSGAPYYGGLQMDLTFQAHYGGYLLQTKGTANNWTPLEQMWVAARAARSGRGFYPWPNTARMCGLI